MYPYNVWKIFHSSKNILFRLYSKPLRRSIGKKLNWLRHQKLQSGVTCSEVRLGQLFETGSKGLCGSEMRWKDGQVLQIRCYLKLLYSRLNQLDFQFVLRATRYRKATEIFNRLRGFVTKYYFNPFYQRRRGVGRISPARGFFERKISNKMRCCVTTKINLLI